MPAIISVIVPVYQTAEYLSRCLDSLLTQTYPHLEIICVDDGSADASASILRTYAQRDNRIHALFQSHAGVSAARNTALCRKTGQYVLFVDSDDWVEPTLCEELMLQAVGQDAAIVMCAYIREWGKRSAVGHPLEREYIVWRGEEFGRYVHRRLFGLTGEELRHPQAIDSIVSPCMQLFRVDMMQKIAFVDLGLIGTGEDMLYQMEVYTNCLQADGSFVYIDKPLYHYRKTNPESLTTAYKSGLCEKWQVLFSYMRRYIEEHHYPDEYRQALNARIVLSMLGLGLNEIAAADPLRAKAARLKAMVCMPSYVDACRRFPYHNLPVLWRGFFWLCRRRHTLLLVLALKVMQFLRRQAMTFQNR